MGFPNPRVKAKARLGVGGCWMHCLLLLLLADAKGIREVQTGEAARSRHIDETCLSKAEARRGG